MPSSRSPPDAFPTLDETLSFFAPECRQKVREIFETCARDGMSHDEELQLVTAKGRCIWVRLIAQAGRDSNNTIARVQGAIQKITEKKQTEDKAPRFADRLTHALGNIADAFFILDRQWRFTYVNSAAECLLQREHKTLLGKIIWHEFKEAVRDQEHAGFQPACDIDEKT